MHRVDSSDARVFGACLGYSVAFPGAGLDRFLSHTSPATEKIDFSYLTRAYDRQGAKIVLNLLAQRDEGFYLQPHVTVQPGTVLRLGEFAGRAKNTIVAAILVGGDFIITDGTRKTRIAGEGIVLTEGEPLTCYCVAGDSHDIPMQLGLTIALPHDTDISRLNLDEFIAQFSISGQ